LKATEEDGPVLMNGRAGDNLGAGLDAIERWGCNRPATDTNTAELRQDLLGLLSSAAPTAEDAVTDA
jgi:hypothetical protein